jgi:hypothetical protein
MLELCSMIYVVFKDGTDKYGTNSNLSYLYSQTAFIPVRQIFLGERERLRGAQRSAQSPTYITGKIVTDWVNGISHKSQF